MDSDGRKLTDSGENSGGILTIYSFGDSSSLGHAWISYTPDDTGIMTTYGTWGNGKNHMGLFANEELSWSNNEFIIEYGIASRTTHIDSKQEEKLMKKIQDYEQKGRKS